MMFEKKRLHPVAIFFNLFTLIRQSLFAIIAGFLSFRGQSLWYFILITLAIFILFFVYSAIAWYRFTYRIENEELRIEHGMIIRKKRYISKNRIQSINLSATVFHRMAKLVKVQIETAGSGDGAEASLRAVTISEGEQLRKQLKTQKTIEDDQDEKEVDHRPIYRSSFKQLFLAGSTSGSIGVILAVAIVGISELERFIPTDIYSDTITWLIGLSIALIMVIIILVLMLLWVLGIAGTMIKYGKFTITKTKDELFVTRGLLEKKQLTIPLNRIQAVGIEQNIFRQPLGYAKIYAVVAGGSLDEGEDFPVLLPIIKTKEVNKFLQTFLPEYVGSAKEWVSSPKRARKYYLLRSSIIFILILLGIGYFFPSFVWVPIILLLASLYLGVLRHKEVGFDIEGSRLTICFRLLSKVTVIMEHRRIQAFEMRQHKIQRFEQLATAKFSIIGSFGAGTHFTLKDLEREDATQLSDWYSYRS